MDALPGTPQIQNIIPTSFFGTNAWAAPWLGLIGSLFIIAVGLIYLERQRRKAQAKMKVTAQSYLMNLKHQITSIYRTHSLRFHH